MKKFFIILLSIICIGCFGAAVGCTETTTEHTHTWVATEETDSDGNAVYVCESCGETHEHTYATEYTHDSKGHWYAATCSETGGCSSAKKGYSEHEYDEDGTVCTVCGYDSTEPVTYSLVFSYYQYDENGDIVVSSSDSSSYVEVGVTYTAVETSFGLVDVENGDDVQEGDVISFTIAKSVYCYYTDSNSYPVAYVNDDSITRGSDGVYTFTVASDMADDDGNLIVWVGNVEMMPETISGSGTESNPYTINSVTDWLYFATYINEDFYTSMNIAYWALGCDLDFEGEEVYIVGDATTTTSAYFMGSFDGCGYTLSNFTISNNISGTYGQYAGLFGVCSAYSGISAVIENLNIDNYTITVSAPSASACVVGSIVGWGMGFNLINCSATNGTITLEGNSSYYSYGGGLIGILQSYYDEDNDVAYYSSLQYNTVSDVKVTGSNIVYAMGGLAGYVYPYAESAPIYIINNAVTDIALSGAIRAGGVVGSVGRYTSIQNSYATGTVSANCTLTSSYDDFEGTQLDDTIAYAGGIAGYCENDTLIAACFFVGSVSASASLATAYTGYLYGGCAAAGYESMYSSALITMNNLNTNSASATSSDITESKLAEAGWQTVDWILSGTYPAINGETVELTYYITVNIDGAEYDKLEISTTATSYVYVPMSYRYLLYDGGKDGGISIYVRKDENGKTYRTYGYYFDEECTQRIPTGYVITGTTTIYAKYADCTDIINKEYYLTGNGVTATVIFNANGSYYYEEGVIYLSGTYEYDGAMITFKDGYFSRLAETVQTVTTTTSSTTYTVSDNQKASYYTFYATINADGNLEIFDCTSVYINTYSTSYDYLARFYTVSDPLLAVAAENVVFAGKYYATYTETNSDGSVSEYTLQYFFDVDYTGTYTDASGVTSSMSYSDNGDGTLSLMIGYQTWTAYLTADLSSIDYITRSSTTYHLTAFDEFEGTWVVPGIVEKTYTFDGMGGWTYMDATLTGALSGIYTVDNGVLSFTYNGVTVTVTYDDGTLNIEESDGDYEVTLYNEYSIMGVWYTYSYSLTRYTLYLYGFNSEGWGEAEFEGTTGFRYTLNDVDSGVAEYYVYYGDSLYAYLYYTYETGILESYFYDSDTEAYDINYTFYIYDDFYGTWVGSSNTFATVTFNGFGFYDVAKNGDNTQAVNGTMTITNTDGDTSKITYVIDLSTGYAAITYDGVQYTLVYDAFTNTITMTAEDGSTIIFAEKDEFADVVFYTTDGTTYAFDGRGYLDGGGQVTITTAGGKTTDTYTIDADGTITIGSYTIYCGQDGYQTSDGTALYVQNSFTGTYAIYGWYKQLTIGEIRYIYDGTNIEVSGSFDGEDITLYYNGEQMWFTVTAEGEDITYYITISYTAVIISTTQVYTEDANKAYMSAPDVLCGTWTSADGTATLTFDGSYDGVYVSYGSVTYAYTDESGEAVSYTGRYYYSNTSGSYVVYVNGTYYYYTIEDAAETYAYTNGTSYLAEKA